MRFHRALLDMLHTLKAPRFYLSENQVKVLNEPKDYYQALIVRDGPLFEIETNVD